MWEEVVVSIFMWNGEMPQKAWEFMISVLTQYIKSLL
jgi:hypothetical protein